MRDYDLHSILQLSGIPGFPLGRVYTGAQDRRADSLVAQDSLNTGGDVVLLRVNGKDLTPASFCKFFLDLFDQPALFGINPVFW